MKCAVCNNNCDILYWKANNNCYILTTLYPLLHSQLKSKCGAQFTAKMEGMLNDLAIGQEHAVSFEKFVKENQQLTGECSVLLFVVVCSLMFVR